MGPRELPIDAQEPRAGSSVTFWLHARIFAAVLPAAVRVGMRHGVGRLRVVMHVKHDEWPSFPAFRSV
jgi:hypothetical protein